MPTLDQIRAVIAHGRDEHGRAWQARAEEYVQEGSRRAQESCACPACAATRAVALESAQRACAAGGAL